MVVQLEDVHLGGALASASEILRCILDLGYLKCIVLHVGHLTGGGEPPLLGGDRSPYRIDVDQPPGVYSPDHPQTVIEPLDDGPGDSFMPAVEETDLHDGAVEGTVGEIVPHLVVDGVPAVDLHPFTWDCM